MIFSKYIYRLQIESVYLNNPETLSSKYIYATQRTARHSDLSHYVVPAMSHIITGPVIRCSNPPARDSYFSLSLTLCLPIDNH